VNDLPSSEVDIMAPTSSPSTLDSRPKPAPRLIAASLVLAIAYVAATLMQKVLILGPVSGLAVALLPTAGCVYFLFEEVRVMRRLDELQQRIQLEALAIGFPAVGVILILLGFLQHGGFLAERVDLGNLWGMLPFCYLFGLLIARKRYQ
jgi:hypothetical protein